jgi:2-polyprenyl-3-methyl-5-hydroxy-6-metoxy-1,4-benzoquinol methylase
MQRMTRVGTRILRRIRNKKRKSNNLSINLPAVAQRIELEAALKRTYFAPWPSPYKETDSFRNDVRDHVDRRYSHFAGCVVPWLKRHVDISGNTVVEVGSGTGSSTAAIAPHVGHIATFEIDALSVEAAKARAAILGYSNVTHHACLFDAEQSKRLGEVDGVFLAAVLEHCTFKECIDLLKASWQGLRPGGWLCVVDTPNRLSPVDLHTSMLPFFSALPLEARVAYAHRSPRADFVHQFTSGEPDAEMRMIRWGCGISYHEFELAISPHVHDWVIANGWEPEIKDALGVLPEDQATKLQLKTFAPGVNRAFARRAFYFIIRKPYGRVR